MVVPCADCLNVVYTNGAYRSIPSPSPAAIDGNTVAVLPYQALNALSFFDNVQQQQSVFVGCANGVQQLSSNGTWAPIPLVTSLVVSLSGQAFAFTAGNFLNTDRLAPSTMTFATGSVSVFLAGSSIVAGSQTVVVQVGDGKVIAVTYTGFSNQNGIVIGSCKNSTVLVNATLLGLFDSLTNSAATAGNFIVSNATNPGQSAFTSITANGQTRTSASASYSYTNGVATWSWTNSPFGFASGSTYPMTVQ
jgi:hypothetical protein